MTREEINKSINLKTKAHYILELATSYGKSKAALDAVFKVANSKSRILILCPTKPIINNWKDEEIVKWGYSKWLNNITFSCYDSIEKHAGKWDFVIADEVHHLSPRCQEALKSYNIKHFIGLSATVKRDVLYFLRTKFDGIKTISANIKTAIESDVLAEPTIYLLGLNLDNTKYNQLICKNKAKIDDKSPIIDIKDKWKVPKGYKKPYKIRCTAQQYYNDITGLIEFYKRKAMGGNQILKNLWLHTAGDRLKWLAETKMDVIKNVHRYINKERSITFCATIEQSEKLNIPCVNSKVGLSNLDKFNKKNTNNIASVAILDEGVSLVDCRICLFQMINSSTRCICQRIGRGMRHSKPIIIFVYYKNTREEEIINKEVLENYPETSIRKISSINQIEL